MDRRVFVAGAMAFVLAPLAGEAQQAGKVWRIGVLKLRSRALKHRTSLTALAADTAPADTVVR